MASLNDLTPRELEILQLVIAGKTNKEIAHEVFISKKNGRVSPGQHLLKDWRTHARGRRISHQLDRDSSLATPVLS